MDLPKVLSRSSLLAGKVKDGSSKAIQQKKKDTQVFSDRLAIYGL